jgi:predicted nucleic acid-binding protein
MNYLLDTNVLIDMGAAESAWKPIVGDLFEGGHFLCVCAVVTAELYAGARPAQHADIERMLAGFHFLPATPAIARLAGILRYDWARRGRSLSTPDTLIAATALESGCILATDNRRDFPMRELKLLALKPRP